MVASVPSNGKVSGCAPLKIVEHVVTVVVVLRHPKAHAGIDGLSKLLLLLMMLLLLLLL